MGSIPISDPAKMRTSLVYTVLMRDQVRNTVVVIEHNLDVIKNADWIIDLGPEGGDRGGEIVAEGPPKEIAKSKRSYTGQVLKEAGAG